jgi:hypothetical protein
MEGAITETDCAKTSVYERQDLRKPRPTRSSPNETDSNASLVAIFNYR